MSAVAHLDAERRAGSLCDAIAAEGDGEKACLRGTHRLLAVEQTVERIRSLTTQCGITRLADITGLDRIGIPVAMACRPNAKSVSVSQGKGLTFAAAAASALVEAMELHHAENLLIPVLHGSPDSMEGSGRRFVLDGLWRDHGTPIDPHVTFAWSEAQDLLTGDAVWLPHDAVHADLTGRQPAGGGFGISSNGLAGGNCLMEAAIHGLCEVIERDSTVRWQSLGRSVRERTRVDHHAIADPDCIMLVERLERADFQVGVWNTTGPTGIPSFHAAILDRRSRDAHPGAGDGAHLSPGIALLRALTEAAQARLTYIAGTRDDIDPEEYRLDRRLDRRGRHEALFDDKPKASFADLADRSGATLARDLATILQQLSRLGHRAYAVDLRHGGSWLSVVRIVVPGMRLPSEAG